MRKIKITTWRLRWAVGAMSAALLLGVANAQAPYDLLHTFAGGSSDGASPYGSLTVGGATLYGMTFFGGTANAGTLFEMNANGSGFSVLHSFAGNNSDGGSPYSTLTLAGSTLYGMTSASGSGNGGTLFEINTNGSGYSILHSFADGSIDGSYPYGSLTLAGSSLFGMTSSSGSNGFGTVFQINTNGGGFSIVHSFAGGSGDGSNPNGSLTLSGSTLYGMTYGGGSTNNDGVLFRMNTDGSGYSILHSFSGAVDGANPSGSLTLVGSTLYGMTAAGGGSNSGTVFQISTDGSGFSLLHSFTGTNGDGGSPQGSLMLIDSTLYGLTSRGGSNFGTVFEINTNGSSYEILHTFTNAPADGNYPNDSLALYGTSLYGMTTAGGSGDGVVFSIGVVPEPSTLALASAGLVALLVRQQWKSRRAGGGTPRSSQRNS